MKKISFILMAAAFVCSCASNSTDNKSYVITGKFDNFKSDSVWLVDQDDEVLAAVPSTDGSFEFRGEIDNPGIRIILKEREPEEETGLCAFILEPGNLTMSTVLDSFYVMTGTKSNEGFSQFMTDNNKITAKIRETNGTATDELIAMIEGRQEKIKTDLLNNLDNFYGLFCLERLADPDDPESTRIFLDRFSQSVKKTDGWKKMSESVDKQLNFGVGKPYLDFTQNDADGNPVTASKVMADSKNKYVLIDFWASWCGPCMSELPYLKDAYNRFSSKGFEILGVSLDQDRDSWLNAVKDNDMNWIHVSDLKYWSNEVAQLYNIHSIPANFLVDCQTGIIVEKGLRGAALVQKLTDLLK